MKIVDLKTEYRENPIGIDATAPRFSWKLQSDNTNMMQTSYRILAYEEEEAKNLIWDSGTIESNQSQRVHWAGSELKSMERIYWKVIVEIRNEIETERSESELSFFEMGLLNKDDWHADWIEPGEQSDYMNYQPAPYLRREFSIKPGLKSARIYQTAHGLYEFWINGKLGTDEKFKPGFTCYQKRIQYQVYDITEMLLDGENTWSVILGDGWWRGMLGGSSRNNWGYKLQFLGQIALTYEDGHTEYICSDPQFKYSYGGIRICDMRAGEVFDITKEPNGWKENGFDDSTWKSVTKTEDAYCEKGNMIPSRSVPVLEKETFEAKLFRDSAGDLILDFGQNIAGYVKMKLRGCKSGQKILLQHGEDIKDGQFSMQNLMAEMFTEERFQKIEYIARGDEEELYCPTLAVFGFRYVKVTGYDGEIQPGDFIAVAIYSSLEETGDFSCSNPLINQLVRNSRWSQKGNYLDVPTDCPTRERSPWTGDSQVYCRTAADFMNVYPFFEKWMQDISCDQMKSGKLKSTIPSGSKNKEENERAKKAFFESIEGKEELSTTDYMILQMYSNGEEDSGVAEGSAGWSDAAVINPYMMYLCYGDRQILENQYESAVKHVEYMFDRAKNANPNREQEPEYHTWTDGELDANYIWDTEFHWGEWLEADVGSKGEMQRMLQKFTNTDPEVPTAFLCYSTRLVGEMAQILGKDEDAKRYREQSEKVKRMINKYMIGEDGVIKGGRQAPNVRALAFNLCDDLHKGKVVKTLVQTIKDCDYHINTGFLATPYILDVLVDEGYEEIAYKLLEQESSPSWLYNVKKGATTILEEWNGMDSHVGSFNHYSYGAVCNFLFTRTAGIKPIMEKPGYQEFIIEPVIGGSLSRAKAIYESLYGTICSEWKKNGEVTEYRIQVPVNTTAVVRIPTEKKNFDVMQKDYPNAIFENGCMKLELGSGMWSFQI